MISEVHVGARVIDPEYGPGVVLDGADGRQP
jgi:hypothetical protein